MANPASNHPNLAHFLDRSVPNSRALFSFAYEKVKDAASAVGGIVAAPFVHVKDTYNAAFEAPQESPTLSRTDQVKNLIQWEKDRTNARSYLQGLVGTIFTSLPAGYIVNGLTSKGVDFLKDSYFNRSAVGAALGSLLVMHAYYSKKEANISPDEFIRACKRLENFDAANQTLAIAMLLKNLGLTQPEQVLQIIEEFNSPKLPDSQRIDKVKLILQTPGFGIKSSQHIIKLLKIFNCTKPEQVKACLGDLEGVAQQVKTEVYKEFDVDDLNNPLVQRAELNMKQRYADRRSRGLKGAATALAATVGVAKYLALKTAVLSESVPPVAKPLVEAVISEGAPLVAKPLLGRLSPYLSNRYAVGAGMLAAAVAYYVLNPTSKPKTLTPVEFGASCKALKVDIKDIDLILGALKKLNCKDMQQFITMFDALGYKKLQGSDRLPPNAIAKVIRELNFTLPADIAKLLKAFNYTKSEEVLNCLQQLSEYTATHIPKLNVTSDMVARVLKELNIKDPAAIANIVEKFPSFANNPSHIANILIELDCVDGKRLIAALKSLPSTIKTSSMQITAIVRLLSLQMLRKWADPIADEMGFTAAQKNDFLMTVGNGGNLPPPRFPEGPRFRNMYLDDSRG